jgi:hypothetical protein
MHIRWTPRSELREQKPEVRLSTTPDLIKLLKDLLVRTLAPFPEAREALCLALVDFDRQLGIISP